MVVKPSPKQKDIESFINKGCQKSQTKKEKRADWELISLRMPPSLLKAIDEELKNHGWVSRNSYILEVLQKNLNE